MSDDSKDQSPDAELDEYIASLLGKANAALDKVKEENIDKYELKEDVQEEDEHVELKKEEKSKDNTLSEAASRALADVTKEKKPASEEDTSYKTNGIVNAETQQSVEQERSERQAVEKSVEEKESGAKVETPAEGVPSVKTDEVSGTEQPIQPEETEKEGPDRTRKFRENRRGRDRHYKDRNIEEKQKKEKEKEPNPFDSLSQVDLLNLMDEHRDNIRAEKNKIYQTIEQIKQLRAKLNAAVTKRDELNKLVQDMIQEAKRFQQKRDEINQKLLELKMEKKEHTSQIKKEASKITEIKQERDKLNEMAKGTVESLSRNIFNSLKTLFTLDLSLKNEIILFEMIMETQERLKIKQKADETHQQIQAQYKMLKEAEGEANLITDEMQEQMVLSQKYHETSIQLFRQKDDVRARADEAHNEVKKIQKEIKYLEDKIKEHNKNIDKYKKELDMMHESLNTRKNVIRSREKLEKLREAKKKATTSGKLDLSDLRLLLEQGELKL